MVSKSFFIAIFSIILCCRLAFSADEAGLGSKQNNSSMPLSDLLKYFREMHHDYVEIELMYMFLVAGYGDHFYAISDADLSPECWRTAAATSLMMKSLAIQDTSHKEVFSATGQVREDLSAHPEVQKHPVELVCAAIEKEYAKNSNLSAIFEKAKKNAVVVQDGSRRPPYFRQPIEKNELYQKIVAKFDVPELAKLFACSTFQSLLIPKNPRIPRRANLFVRSCQAVAKDEGFVESMQKIYEKTIADVLPEIMVDDRYGRFSTEYTSWAWFEQSLVKNLYGYVAKDPILMKQVLDKAAIIGKDASVEDLDFSKL